MIRHADSQLFYQDSVHKDWMIHIEEDNVTLTNQDILADELTIQESLCSDQDITLGSCVASNFEFKMFNTGRVMKGKTLTVTLVLNGHTDNPVPIGVYKVEDDTLTEDERIREIKAHDALYEILEKDFAPWYNEELPDHAITLKEFRDSFFEYAEIEQEEVTLVNDWVTFTFEVANSERTKRMIDEENEKIQQLREQAELGYVLFEYNEINLNTYDPTKKENKVTYTKVENVQESDDPYNSGWYVLENDNYRRARKTSVQHHYINIAEAIVHEGDNPQQLGLYEKAPKGSQNPIQPTTDTTPEKDKTYYTADWVIIDYYDRDVYDNFNPYKLGWYTKVHVDPDEYELCDSTMQTVTVGTTYYEKVEYTVEPPTYKEVIGVEATDNPSEKKWYEYNPSTGKYDRSTDQTADLTKTYFEQCLPENRASAMLKLNLEYHTGQNPKEQGWYELANDAYFKSNDQTINYNKDYYVNIWEIDQNDQSDIIYDTIKGADIIQAICEINGVFGHIGRTGVFQYVKIKPIDEEGEGLYPDPELYPDPNLYPAGQPVDQEYTRSLFETCEKEAYKVAKLDRLVICKEDGDSGYVYPANSHAEDHNTYKITGNFIWYNFTENQQTLNIVGNNLLTQGIAQISEYTPFEMDCMGNPCIEVGDSIKVVTRLGTFYTYVLQRTLTGSQRLKDTFKAQGNEKRQNEHTLYDSVIELKGKSNILTRNIDMTRNEIIDMGENLSSLIEQTAESIKMEVSREVKNTEDNITDKYQSAVKYTDDQISQTVTRTMYNADKEELQQWRSGIEINYDSISASVENSVKKTGGSTGFKWELTDTGWTLQAKGQYKARPDNPAEDQIPVTNPTGKNPAEEEWHELVSTNPDVYELTIDTTPQSGKTYYKSEKDPNALGWLEVNGGHFELTQDHNIKTSKTYYEQTGSSQWSDVLVANANGVEIPGYINTKELDVRGLATISMLQATRAEIDALDVDIIGTKDEVTGLRNRVEEIYTQYLDAERIKAIVVNTSGLSADNITTGTMSADRVRLSGWFAGKTITTGTLSATQLSATRGIFDSMWINNGLVVDFDGHERQITLMQKTIGTTTIKYLGFE